ncbi:MAG: bifunctional demethylmenaquinone methyltransferase/2-methoxy-6-polyprenyl-1,4-benzoquinol methylase UbiE [bacterium]
MPEKKQITGEEMKRMVLEMNRPENKEIKHNYVRKMFNTIAPSYDLMNTVSSFGIHYMWRNKAVRLAGVKSGYNVLDVCCGTGDFSIASAKAVGSAGKVTGLDFSSGMLKQAKEKIKGRPFENNISFQEGDAEKLPFPDNKFDVATVGCGIRNLTSLEQGFSEMRRVVKPGGRVVCLDLGRPVIPIFQHIYIFYFFKVVPFLGQIVSNQREAYTYLPHSLHSFPGQEELKKIMEKVGLKDVRYWNLFGGAMAIHIGIKSL